MLPEAGSAIFHVEIHNKTILEGKMTINIGRVVLGGIVAGIVMDAYEAVMNGIVLAPEWAAILKSLGLPQFTSAQIILFNIVGLVTGLIAVWTYAAIRPRFGAGARTALIAAAFVWLAVKVMAVVYPTIWGIYPLQTMAELLALQIGEIAAGTLAGAWLYREAD
jgi:hypothetical protein